MLGFLRKRLDRSGKVMMKKSVAPNTFYVKYGKRWLDAMLALLALFLLSPVVLLIAVLVRIQLGSPVIFCQERPGKGGKIFKLYKFRSMTDKKDKRGNLLPDEARLTAFGKWLRSTSLDELPELVNILKGDMAVVGPRPLLIKYLPYYSEKERHRHDIRPGLTGLAQISGRNYLNWDKRLALDVKYVENCSFFMDVKIVLKTVRRVIKRADVAVDTNRVLKDLDCLRGEEICGN